MKHHLQGIGMTSQRTRDRMVERLQLEGISNADVLQVMRKTPRHIFVDEALASRAYEDIPLPIGYNQTISQPYIVAQMTELLLENGYLDKVLEIGTGCGYQTAILAQLVEHVYTIERIHALQKKAQSHLAYLDLQNISYLYTDGSMGWSKHAPFAGILVSAVVEEVPPALLAQLAQNGVMVIPVITQSGQVLQRITRLNNDYKTETLEYVSFVPFLSGVA